METIHVVHIIHSLTLGGAARTMIATAKYAARALKKNSNKQLRNSLVILNLKHTDPKAVEFALEQGMEIPVVRTRDDLQQFLPEADIVQINWWQHPDMDEFLRSALPPCRLLGWFHCACDTAPQFLTDELASICDFVLGGSSYTYLAPAISRMPTALKAQKTGFVVGGADFSRLKSFERRKHGGFNVGYIGTVNPVKMYERFVPLHQGLDIPNVKVIVCGGDEQLTFGKQADDLGLTDLFDFRGYVDDVQSVLSEFDVYGYPLCKMTYAASELNLQEAMYCGLPAVVFPHGGLKTLVINDYNGLVVNSESAYREALQYLYRNPAELARLSKNAGEFAREKLGAENNAPNILPIYEKLLQQPKKTRVWPGYISAGTPAINAIGAKRFMESLGEHGAPFVKAYSAQSFEETMVAEEELLKCSAVLTLAGLLPYAGAFADDAFLQLWSGIALTGIGRGYMGAEFLLNSLQKQLAPHGWRIFLYLLLIAKEYEDSELERTSEQTLMEHLTKDQIEILLSRLQLARQTDLYSLY